MERKVVIGLFGDDRDLDQKIRDAKEKLDRLKAQQAKIPIDGDTKQLLVKIREAELKLDKLASKKVDPKVDLAGYEKTSLEIDKLDLKLDHLAVKTAGTAGKSLTVAIPVAWSYVTVPRTLRADSADSIARGLPGKGGAL